MAACAKKQGMSLDNGVPIKYGLVAEYRFDECRNLLKYSQQFDNAAWTKTRLTATSNDTTAPDGTATADKVLESADTNTHLLANATSDLDTAVSTFSIYVKPIGRTWCALLIAGGGKVAYFDVVNGTVGNADPGYTGSIVSVGNSWYRCSITGATSATPESVYFAGASANGTLSYAGDITKGYYVWGAQLEVGGSATTYVPTTDKQTLTDYSGNANHGTLGITAGADTNDPTWTGNGQYLTTDDYDILGGVSEFALSNYTICVVWNPNTADTADVLLSKNTAAATGAGNKGFILAQTATGTGDLTLSQFDSDGGGTLHTVSSASSPAASTWHYSVAACDGTTLYLSAGQAAALTAGATTMTAAAPNTVKNLYLGRYAHDASGYFAGSIAYIAIYNRKLAQSEIAKNYVFLKSYLKRQRGITLA